MGLIFTDSKLHGDKPLTYVLQPTPTVGFHLGPDGCQKVRFCEAVFENLFILENLMIVSKGFIKCYEILWGFLRIIFNCLVGEKGIL